MSDKNRSYDPETPESIDSSRVALLSDKKKKTRSIHIYLSKKIPITRLSVGICAAIIIIIAIIVVILTTSKPEPDYLPMILQIKLNPGTVSIILDPATYGEYDFTVNWGDSCDSGNEETVKLKKKDDVTIISHKYLFSGTYVVTLIGTVPHLRLDENNFLSSIASWGQTYLKSLDSSFTSSTSLQSVANDGDFSNVVSMAGLFHGCRSIYSLDASGWDTSSVTDLSNAFSDMTSLQHIDISGWTSTAKVTTVSQMFKDNKALEGEVDVSTWDTSSIEDFSEMFAGVEYVSTLNVSGWDTSSATNMHRLFYQLATVKTLDVSGFDVSNVVDLSDCFYRVLAAKAIDVSAWDTSSCTNMARMFYDNQHAGESINPSNFKMGLVSDAHQMFRGCPMSSLDLSGWDTSSITTLKEIFLYSSMTHLNLSGWKLSAQLEDVSSMFSSSTSSVDLTGWDTSEVSSFASMFASASSLKTIANINGLSMESATDLSNMFKNCGGLTSLNVSSWLSRVNEVTTTNSLFHSCNRLEDLDISGWDMTAVSDHTNMCYSCPGCDIM